MQERYRKKLTGLPFCFTFANAFLGFIATTQALEGNYAYAIYSIMLAAVMDMCDGRLARALGSSNDLGMELDSLADGISFVLAPCVVVYSWYPGTIGYTGFIALGIYLSAGLYRLAKYNITAAEQSSYFIGLPVPMAAFFVASTVLYHEWILGHRMWFMLYKRVPFLLIALVGFLMVSPIRFPNHRIISSRSHYMGVGMLSLVLFSLVIVGYPVPLFMAIAYIVASVMLWNFYRYCA